jgi:ATP-dependent DNA helicase Rep
MLNPQQKKAVEYTQGPLLVIAGAGSGKTGVITQKIIHLIKDCDINAKNILALTFTNKAAQEMQARINKHLSKSKTRGMHISTFHTFGLRFIRTHTHAAGLKKNFTLFDPNDSFHLLKTISEELIPVTDETLKNIRQQISTWKNKLVTPVQAANHITENWQKQALEFYKAYETALKAYHAIDLDDLIFRPYQILSENPDLKTLWQNNIRYLLVDEYQDTNRCQYELVRLLTGPEGRFTFVGDDDQSIYAWRGADPENLNLLQKDFSQLNVVKLEQNYRSTETILKAANALISHNSHIFEKKLWSSLGPGDPIEIFPAQDEYHEAEHIAHWIMSIKSRSGSKFKDFAILYRSNHQARILEQILKERYMPYQISGGNSFFDHAEIKDLLAYFRLCMNHEDDAAFIRIVNVPKREIGSSTLSQLANYAKQREKCLYEAASEFGLSSILPEKSYNRLQEFTKLIENFKQELESSDVTSTIDSFIENIKFNEYIATLANDPQAAARKQENVRMLLAWLKRFMDQSEDSDVTLMYALQKILLVNMLERQSDKKSQDAIQLMTLHTAKGLEFPFVSIIGLEEELLPHKNSMAEDKEEEERRLAYVGITRAQRRLILSFSQSRQRFGEKLIVTPSRFLKELPEECLDWYGQKSSEPEETAEEEGMARFAQLRAMLDKTD